MTMHPRRAFTLVEMGVACALLGFVFAVLGQFVSRWDAARRSVEERACALRLVENVLERATIAPAGTTLTLDADAAARLRSAELKISEGPADDAGLMAVTASLSWVNAEGQRVSPVAVTAWKRSAPKPTEDSR
ncbi:hypothetical protein Pan44_43130 [Caulifigura coniformis]|uniref:Prepilin-type N-terminal cleavage/methylation domain-containing protein n=1 Tax=Caulifigura coniformis TaxID=2527983 RepID=A0A517SJF6_9PLAN|nr:type II secretion system protein [Caulifigura coniformis]QDT56261.1 hypothetical protein Pan44_43130 [Caulifigura coniformis]